MIWNAALGLLDTVLGGVKDHFEAKRKLKKAKVETQLAIEHAKATATIDWNAQAMLNAQTSWKDEYLLLLFSPPLIMAFIPPLAPYVGLGFAELDKIPDWYKASLGVMVAASYGHRKLIDMFARKKS